MWTPSRHGDLSRKRHALRCSTRGRQVSQSCWTTRWSREKFDAIAESSQFADHLTRPHMFTGVLAKNELDNAPSIPAALCHPAAPVPCSVGIGREGRCAVIG